MLRLAVVGAAGKMGREVVQALETSRVARLVAGIDPKSRAWKSSLEEITESRIDGVVDFSEPRGAVAAAKWCAKHHKFLISGTTGMRPAHVKQLKASSRKAAIMWSPNMSLGVAVLRKAMTALGGLKDFDFQVEEIHHKHKKDRPSGTALLLH